MQLTDGDEKCVLKLYMYKTAFGKFGHICGIIWSLQAVAYLFYKLPP